MNKYQDYKKVVAERLCDLLIKSNDKKLTDLDKQELDAIRDLLDILAFREVAEG